MSKKGTNKRKDSLLPLPKAKKGFFGLGGIVLALAIAAVLGFWWHHLRQTDAMPTAAPILEAAAKNPLPTVAEADPGWRKLKGRWLRPDGGYVIEINRVGGSGKLDAAYFNPKPIHVAIAEATRDRAGIKVFIELRDVNYPGSTYTLTYEPGSDQLQGVYFQAMQKQSYEVVFVRLQGDKS
jgi:hypothetical protein